MTAERRPAEPQRSAVTIWRSGKGRRWSVRVVDGTTSEDLDRLVELALGAGRRIEGRASSGSPRPRPATEDVVECSDYAGHRDHHRMVDGSWICTACDGGPFA
jgi:hypothetical protein